MSTQANLLPSMIGSFVPNATATISPSARTVSMKELFSRASSVLRRSLALLTSVAQVAYGASCSQRSYCGHGSPRGEDEVQSK
jgi:hypothetical protein